MYSWVISRHVSFLTCDIINPGNIIQVSINSNEYVCSSKKAFPLASFISKVTGQADNPDDFVDIDQKLPTEDTDHLPSTKPDSDNDSDEDTHN